MLSFEFVFMYCVVSLLVGIISVSGALVHDYKSREESTEEILFWCVASLAWPIVIVYFVGFGIGWMFLRVGEWARWRLGTLRRHRCAEACDPFAMPSPTHEGPHRSLPCPTCGRARS